MKKAETDSKKTFRITPKIVKRYLVYLILLLFGLHILGKFLKQSLGFSLTYFFVYMFDLNGESNIPATYSTLAILICALLLWCISFQKREHLKKRSIYWKMLSLIFVFLAFDEYFSIHEKLNISELSTFANGFFHYSWFLPYLLLFGVIGLFFIKFLFQLPIKTRASFIIAGVTFLLGAVGFEMIGGKIDFEGGGETILYLIVYSIEEFLEMLGIVLFITALMKYWLQEGGVAFHINQDENSFDMEKEELDVKLEQKEKSYKKV